MTLRKHRSFSFGLISATPCVEFEEQIDFNTRESGLMLKVFAPRVIEKTENERQIVNSPIDAEDLDDLVEFLLAVQKRIKREENRERKR